MSTPSQHAVNAAEIIEASAKSNARLRIYDVAASTAVIIQEHAIDPQLAVIAKDVANILAEKDAAIRELVTALERAMEWNWIDEDISEYVNIAEFMALIRKHKGA